MAKVRVFEAAKKHGYEVQDLMSALVQLGVKVRSHLSPVDEEEVHKAFETLGEEGGRQMTLGIHPWIFGQAHRIRYLDEALARVAGSPGAWFATTQEIADAYLSATT